jgi:hypothetical protein
MIMFLFTTWALRLFGISGILGSIFFISGDLSYNHIPGSKASVAEKMSGMAESRLLRAGTLGVMGCWLYTLATLHLYLAFRPAGDIFAFSLTLVFGAVMICFGISHTAYFAIASGAKVAAKVGSDPETGGKLGNVFFQRLVNITYIPVGIASLMMLYAVISGHSLYPRWMVVCLPIVIYILKAPILRLLKGHLRELVNDSYDNLVLFVFYLLSTLVLWNGIVS